MRVFASAADLPAKAATPAQLTAQLIEHARAQIEALQPCDAATLHAYRETMGVAYRYALNAVLPQERELCVQELDPASGERVADGSAARAKVLPGAWGEGCSIQRLFLGRASAGERTPALLFQPFGEAAGAVLVVHPEGKMAAVEYGRGALVPALLARRLSVLVLDAYGTGDLSDLDRDRTVDHFTCFNPTDTALRVQDILTALAYLRARAYTVPGAAHAAHLVGLAQAGLWCLLARALAGPAVGRTVVDASQFDCDDDDAWLGSLDLPLLRRAGDLRTAVALSAPGLLWVHNAAQSFPSAWCRQAYRAAGTPDALHIRTARAGYATIVAWLTDKRI
jgi:hypothetical protein